MRTKEIRWRILFWKQLRLYGLQRNERFSASALQLSKAWCRFRPGYGTGSGIVAAESTDAQMVQDRRHVHLERCGLRRRIEPVADRIHVHSRWSRTDRHGDLLYSYGR